MTLPKGEKCTWDARTANDLFAQTSFLYGGNAAYIEDLHARYQADPSSVDADWQAFFGAIRRTSSKRDAAKEAAARHGSGRTGRSPPTAS
jgi:2-oxoglutarate dehydrogenase E1 component